MVRASPEACKALGFFFVCLFLLIKKGMTFNLCLNFIVLVVLYQL